MNERRRKPKFNFNPKPFRPVPLRRAPVEQPRQPMRQHQAPFTPFRAQRQTRLPQPEEEEHTWTADQWEEWAENEYINNPDAQLPEWFIEEKEGEQEE